MFDFIILGYAWSKAGDVCNNIGGDTNHSTTIGRNRNDGLTMYVRVIERVNTSVLEVQQGRVYSLS